MGTSVGGVDGVDEGTDGLVVTVGVLQRHLDVDAVALSRDVDGFRIKRGLVHVEVLHELGHSALVVESLGLACPLVLEVDGDLLVQERLVPEPLLELAVVKLDGLEYLRVRVEGDLRTGLLRLPYDLDGSVGDTDLVGLAEDLALPLDRCHEFRGQSVDDGDSHSVESSGDLVAVAVELSSGVELGERQLQCGLPLLMHPCGDSPSVVYDGARTVLVYDHEDLVRETRHCLIDTVVDDLVDEMVETAGLGTSDVHSRSLPYRLETLQDDDAVRTVI